MGSNGGPEAVRAEELATLAEDGTDVPAPSQPVAPESKQPGTPGTPPFPPPKSPEELSSEAVPEPLAKKSRKAAVKEVQDSLVVLTSLVTDTVTGMQKLTDTVKTNHEDQKHLQEELQKLSTRMETDSVSTRVIYNSLSEFQRSLTNCAWQLGGSKRDSQTSCKEMMLRIEDFAKQSATRLLEQKNETRRQSETLVNAVNDCTKAVKQLEAAIRAGTELNAATAVPPAVPPPAPAVEVNPPAPKAAPAPPMGSVNDPQVAAPTGPGYGSAALGRSSMGTDIPPPMYNAPPPAGYRPPGSRAGRLRIQQRDGTVVARAVSPNGRHAHSIDQTWSSEYGLGTVTFSGLVYRILPDAFLDGSLPMN